MKSGRSLLAVHGKHEGENKALLRYHQKATVSLMPLARFATAYGFQRIEAERWG